MSSTLSKFSIYREVLEAYYMKVCDIKTSSVKAYLKKNLEYNS